MKQEYDIKNLNPENPYAKQLKRQITINIDGEYNRLLQSTVTKLHGIPYQTLINLYLQETAQTTRDWTTKPIMATKKGGTIQYSLFSHIKTNIIICNTMYYKNLPTKKPDCNY